jgi:4-hydroxybenzoyl-CoA thioesterase
MQRVTIDWPDPSGFITELEIRITDINYGGHLGNDRLLSLVHEARVQWLASHDWTELDVDGIGLIMTDAGTGEELARVRTGMAFFDYQSRKIARAPKAFVAAVSG